MDSSTPNSTPQETEGGSNSQSPKPKKKMLARSNVWNHFTRTKESYNKCLCHYCHKGHKAFACATKSGTSNLKKHIALCKDYKLWLAGQNKSQPMVSSEGLLKTLRVSQDIVREASHELIVIAELPLSFVECDGWKRFCDKVNLYRPYSRRTTTRDILEAFVAKKAALTNWLFCNKQRVSLTTDIWVCQVTSASYMVITAHFIDSEWQLRKLIIGFKNIPDHKGKTISTVLLDCLAEWGIEKVFCMTVDNATTNSSALRRFKYEFSLLSTDSMVLDGEFLHMRCCAHIINLIVKEGLIDLGANVDAIRNAITYVRSSTNRVNAFDVRVTTAKITRGSLPLDVKTRWNSTYLMLSKAIEYRLAFDMMEAEDKIYNEYFLEVDKNNVFKRCGPPTSTDWNVVDRLVKFLVIFYNSTLVVSASTKVNSYKCYGEIVTIERNLSTLANSLDDDLKIKANDTLQKFLKYWEGMEKINRMLIVATVFDPTKKMTFAKMCFEILYGKDSVQSKEMYASVSSLLATMFEEYSARFSRGSGQQSSQTHETVSQTVQEQGVDRMELSYQNFGGYERMEFVYKDLVAEIGEEPMDELETYLKEPIVIPKVMLGTEFDVLSWRKVNQVKFPVLAEMAKDLFAMQVSSVASESAFSTSKRVLEPHRSCLTHYMVEILMCLEQWFKADFKIAETALTNEQILADLEMLESLQREFESMTTGDQT